MKKILLSLMVMSLTGCSSDSFYNNSFTKEAELEPTTQSGRILASLPKPVSPVPVVVYEFQDQTGQFKSNDNFVEYSSAVTKGGLSVLIKSLLDASNGNFFMVAERGGLNNLLKERQIIRTMRNDYASADGTRLGDIPPMIYGGMLLEGGIIFYDSNTLTGGAAAGYFGISGSTQYRRDIVSIYLRAVDVQTGKVLLSVNSSKTVFSYGVSTNVLRYFSVDRLFAAEAGYTVNEPGQLAVRQAIESAVYSLTMEGATRNLWSFSDKAAGQRAIDDYIARRDKGRKEGAADTDSTTPMRDFPANRSRNDLAPIAPGTTSKCHWGWDTGSSETPETVVSSNTRSTQVSRRTPPQQSAPSN